MTNPTRASHFFIAAVLAASISVPGCLSEATDGEEAHSQSSAISGQQPSVALIGGEWLLIELDGKPATAATDDREPFIAFDDEGKAGGFAGCNRFTGGFESAGDELRFSPLAATRMACQTGMEREMRFLQSLDEIERFAIRNDELSLFADGEAPRMRFKHRSTD